MKARILSLFLALTLLTGSASPALAAGGYSDVPRDHWAAQSVRRAGELGLFQGVGGGRFGLGEPITRAAFVTALVRLFGWEAERPQSPAFSDVPAGAWYFSAVETAFAHDAFRLQQGRFRPEEPITREEMAVMLVRSLGYTSLAVTLGAEECPFTDVSVSPGYITLAYDLGIVGGTARQRWELLASIMQSCRCRGYRMLVFMAEYSDLASDFGRNIREVCDSVPNAELLETTAQWCARLGEIDDALTEKRPMEDTICIFIGLEIAHVELGRLSDRHGGGGGGASSFLSTISRYAADPANPPAVPPRFVGRVR